MKKNSTNLMKIVRIYIFSIASIVVCSTSVSYAEFQAEHFTKKWREAPYKTAIISKGTGAVKALNVKKTNDDYLLNGVEDIFNNQNVLSLILVDENNNIVFEKYKNGANKNTLIAGYSMTKSLVSITIGAALCDGVFESLDDAASNFSNSLKGTAYGNATLRQLLMMASSGSNADTHGMPKSGLNNEFIRERTTSIRDAFRDYGINQPNPSTLGTFSYKGLDTAALSIALADKRKIKFQEALSKYIWSKIGAEYNGEIQVDKNSDAVVESGFGATSRDWIRSAIFIRDNLKQESCFGNYLKDATRKQIANNTSHGAAFAGYGYQFWTDNKLIQGKTAWFNGYGGQRLGIDTKSGRIALIMSAEGDYAPQLYKLFNYWINRSE